MSDSKPEQTERLLETIVKPKLDHLFDKLVTSITLEEEKGREFVMIEQTEQPFGAIAINPDQWPAIRRAVDQMVREIHAAKI